MTLTLSAAAQAQNAVPVTVDNFIRAETDHYLATNAKEAGGLGKFFHSREPASIDKQAVIRMNRDTLYSFAVLDLAAGPVTITLPNSGKRFMSLMVLNEDHYVQFVAYDNKPHTISQKNMGTRYAFAAVRTLVDPNDPKDLEAVHKLQDAIKISQKDTGKLELPNWDEASLKEVREGLLALAKHSGFDHAFGKKEEVNPVHHLIGTAAGWGGNPDKDASYKSFTPEKNDGKTVYRLNVPANVPVDAFWSISLYNAKGFFEKNQYDAYSVNDITAKKNADGSVTVQFGGCDGKIPNCLPTVEGWNYTARMYRPRQEILKGSWKFPEARIVE
ncbi:DUF1214 domain-containing protein [Variovorax sp. Sphag1AA]|uniref:DUF1214 domain-containing protein n=1 Tax=Variovorax sp. Sphag1AA TaxID=2587027 RepID=UPI0017928257|nr:DUF1254 domain-containing protein [Variovorax sp. Sphag1AA]MBB3179302.1 hypothetical protein [Variovorax sp. Sphag1AA]